MTPEKGTTMTEHDTTPDQPSPLGPGGAPPDLMEGGEVERARVARYEHRVTVRFGEGWPRYEFHCDAPPAALCRAVWNCDCEEYAAHGVDERGPWHELSDGYMTDYERQAATPTRHYGSPGGECGQLLFITEGDVDESGFGEVTFPISLEWDGETYLWEPAQDVADSGLASVVAENERLRANWARGVDDDGNAPPYCVPYKAHFTVANELTARAESAEAEVERLRARLSDNEAAYVKANAERFRLRAEVGRLRMRLAKVEAEARRWTGVDPRTVTTYPSIGAYLLRYVLPDDAVLADGDKGSLESASLEANQSDSTSSPTEQTCPSCGQLPSTVIGHPSKGSCVAPLTQAVDAPTEQTKGGE